MGAFATKTIKDAAGVDFDQRVWDESGAGTGPFQIVTAPRGRTVKTTVTRAANTTPYSINDNVGGAISFPNIGPSGADIQITGVELEIDVAAVPAGMTTFRLYLYNVTPPSAVADNGAWDLPSGDRASFLGYVDIGTPVDLGATLYVRTNNIAADMKLSGTGLFGYLVTAAGYTPAGNSEVYQVTLHVGDR